MFNKYNLGIAGKDPADLRDYQLSSIQEDAPLPKSFDLRNKMQPTTHQNWGSCTASATAIQEFFDKIDLARKFTYYKTKEISGFYNMQGDFVRNALKAIVKYGVCLESTFPDIRRLTWKKYLADVPSQEACEEALEHRGGSFWAVGTEPEQYKQAIWQQQAPVVFSMRWAKSYNHPKNGILGSPDKWVSGHCVVAVGWTEDSLIVRNTFRKGWGDKNYFYIPFKDWDKHEIWNAYILLNRKKPEWLEGWVAINYLTPIHLIKGTKMKTKANLNVRDNPAGDKVEQVKKGGTIEVVNDDVIKTSLEGKCYLWQKVRFSKEEL